MSNVAIMESNVSSEKDNELVELKLQLTLLQTQV